MAHWFTFTDIAIMASQTVAGISGGMVKRHKSKVLCDMTIGAILVESSRYMIRQFAHTDHIVVARITVISNAEMIVGTRAESARGMAVATILITGSTRVVRNGWHMFIERRGKWLTCGSNLRWYRTVIAMAGLTVSHKTIMIEAKGRLEVFGAMTRSTIGAGNRVV